MRFGDATWLDDLLAAVSARLVTGRPVGLSADCVFETLASDEDHLRLPPADQFLTIRPLNFGADQAILAGALRYAPAFDGRLRVACLCRAASDQEFRSGRELKLKTQTTLALFLKVLDALTDFQPLTADGTGCYLREPMRPESFSCVPKRIQDTSWSAIESFWQMKLVAALPSGNS